MRVACALVIFETVGNGTTWISARAEPVPTEDRHWRGGFQPPGFSDFVMDLEPFQGKLVATGMFRFTGRTVADKVALFDGTSWSNLAEGLPEAGRIDAAVEFRGELVVGGGFIDGGNIFAWNGSTWRPLGMLDGRVTDLSVFEDRLIAVGAFQQADGVDVNGIASWNGETWSSLGGGLTGGLAIGSALLEHEGKLYVGGTFLRAGSVETRGLAVWDGSTWSSIGSVGSGISVGSVEGFAVFRGDLIIGGDFLNVDGVPAQRVACWNGVSWSALGEGVGAPGEVCLVWTVAVHDDELYVGGSFDSAGGVATANVASWDGQDWSSVGGGVRGAAFPEVDCLRSFGGALYIGGKFETAGDFMSWCLAKWNGTSFEPQDLGDGLMGSVWTFARWGDQVIAGGNFVSDGRGNALMRIAAWDGSRWSPLGAGFDDLVHAVEVVDGEVMAGGNFSRTGERVVSHVARWNGAGWDPMGEGFDGNVWDLQLFEGKLIAGGEFTHSGTTPVAHVARWDGSAWGPLGDGLDGVVGCFAVYQGELYAGGAFTIGNAASGGIARWTGTEWVDVRGGMNGAVRAMTEWQGRLAIGGYFSSAGGTPASRLATWDGDSLIGITASVATEVTIAEVNALATIGGSLFVGGIVLRPWESEEPPVIGIARLHDGNWSLLGSGVDQTVHELMSFGTSLFVGGNFLTAGDKGSMCIAVWDEEPVPVTIQDLSASWDGGRVILEWVVSGSGVGDLVGIDVERAEVEGGPYLTLTSERLLPEVRMFFTDSMAAVGREYWYRVVSTTMSGASSIAGPIHVATSDPALPLVELAMPLVRDDGVVLRFRIGTKTATSLRVYDVRGRRVRELIDGMQDPGSYERTWDRTDDSGIRVAPGVYLVELQALSQSCSRKIIIPH